MYEAHGAFTQPEDPDAKIWRYMDICKFWKMLSDKSLYFRRANAFEDQFEGRFPNRMAQALDDNWEQAVNAQPPELRELARLAVDNSRGFFRDLGRRAAINCWHMNEHESSAMWTVYLKGNPGVAIESTVERLRQSFGSSTTRIYLGMVDYYDFENATIPLDNLYYLLISKRMSFRYEQELRAVATMENFDDFEEEGINVACDLHDLIERVYIAPGHDQEFRDSVEGLLASAGLDVPIEASELDIRPIW